MDLNHIPLAPPTPPQISNFDDPVTLAHAIQAVSVVCLSLMIPFALIRIYSKAWIVKSFGWEDVSCMIAIIGSISYVALVLSSLNVTGRHVWDVPVSAFTPQIFQKQVLGYEMSYGPIIFFTKLSILLLYLRLFSPHRSFRLAIYAGISVNFIFYLTTSIIFGALCLPRHGQPWLESAQTARCRSSVIMDYPHGIFGPISDFYIFVLPMPIVMKLKLPLRKKIGICAIFATGFLACVASIIGLWLRMKNYHTSDWSYSLGETSIAVIIEINTGVICSCAPSVATFFRHHTINASSVFSLRKLRAKISKQPSSIDGFDRVGSLKSNDIRLETQILASSVKAEGKFISAKDLGWQGSQIRSTTIV